MTAAVKRNDPCPCGSGKKYKKCCLEKEGRPAVPVSSAPNTDALWEAALAQHRAGRLAEAERLYREVLARQPAHGPALHRLGLLAYQCGHYEAARQLMERALEDGGAAVGQWSELGLVYQALGRYEEAVSCHQRTVARDPDPAAHHNLGLALASLGRHEEALAHYQKALSIKPDLAESLNNSGDALNLLGRASESISLFRKALALNPAYVEAHVNLGNRLLAQAQIEPGVACFDRALSLMPDLAFAHDSKLLALNYCDVSPEAVYAAHRGYSERFEARWRRRWPAHRNDRDPARRLKIGYLSADLRAHSVAFFIEPVLSHHDRAEVEVYCYYNNGRRDPTTDQLQRSSDHWVPCKTLDDGALAARIEADGIDILVDLAGHTAGNRLPVFARKPAPVQVSYLGYPATTGLSAIDYRLVTWDTDPAGAEAYHSEGLYRLPRSLWCYRPAGDSPAVRARGQERIVFGSLNNLVKLSEATVRVWSEILKRVPGSRLAFSNLPEGKARDLLRARFLAQGIEAERLVLNVKLPQATYYELLNAIDIALDPFPYNGTTTTCQGLWMGLPVVSLIGKTSVARSGYALLKAVGLEELAGRDEEEYIQIAVTLAGDLPRLRTLRSTLRERMAASALRDEAGFTREIEAAYRSMWRAWCQR